ncbi:MAG: nickel-dependent hydrogenase large subunit, partial [Chloroflexi bacterium]|nr:nickel-dependent hydrogenase large subunit [Chloroflexota bacterium]
MTKLIVDPITRIEGHLKIEVTLENGKVVDAKSCGTMFRGIETLMEGRHPMDAPTISQRVCGVCPTSHSVASNLALEDAFG